MMMNTGKRFGFYMFAVVIFVVVINLSFPPNATASRTVGALTSTALDSSAEKVDIPIECDDSNPCTTDFMDPLTGDCVFETKNCDDGNPCTVDSCDPVSGECVNQPIDDLNTSEMWINGATLPDAEILDLAQGTGIPLYAVGGEEIATEWQRVTIVDTRNRVLKYQYSIKGTSQNSILYINSPDGQWHEFTPSSLGYSDMLFTSVQSYGQNLFVGTNKGLLWIIVKWLYIPDLISPPILMARMLFNSTNGLPGDWIASLDVDETGAVLWVGVRGTQYYQYAQETKRRHWTCGGGVAIAHLSLEMESLDWQVFAGNSDITAQQGVRGMEVRQVIGLESGGFWTLTENGLSGYKDGGWFYTSRIPGLVAWDEALRISVDDDSEALWTATSKGLACWQDEWKVYTTDNSDIPSIDVNNVFVSSLGKIVIVTGGGIASLNPCSGKWTYYDQQNLKACKNLLGGNNGEVWTAAKVEGKQQIMRLIPKSMVSLIKPEDGSLVATEGGEGNMITLSWTGIPQADAYDVLLDGASIGRSSSTSMDVELPPKSYSWTVSAIFPTDISGPSPIPFSFTILYTPKLEGVDFLLTIPYVHY